MNYMSSPQVGITVSRSFSLLRSHFFTFFLVLVGQLLIVSTAAAAPTVTFDYPTQGADVPDNQDLIVEITPEDVNGIKDVILWSKELPDAPFISHDKITGGPYEWNLGKLPIGDYRLNAKATADDPTGTSTLGSITFSVVAGAAGNLPPVITAGPTATPSTIPVGGTVSLTVAANDPDGDSLAYSWVDKYNTGNAAIVSPNQATTDVVFSAAGTYTLEVTVDDGQVSTAGTVVVTVTSDLPSDPTVTFDFPAAGTDVPAMQDVIVKIDASDDSGITTVYLWSKETSDAAFTPHGLGVLTNGTYQWNIGQLAVGEYKLNAKATANDSASVTETMTFNAIAGTPTSGPTVYFVSPTSNLTEELGYVLSIEADASDDTGVTSVELLHNNDSVETLTSPAYNFSAITFTDTGVHTFELVATDEDNNTDTATLTVTIINPDGGGDLIVSPANGAGFNAGDEISVETNAPATFYLNGYKMEMSEGTDKVVGVESDKMKLRCRNLEGGTYTVTAVAGAITESITFTVTPAMISGQYNFVRLNGNKPIINRQTFFDAGATRTLRNDEKEYDNINGPSVINVTGIIDPAYRVDPSAKYYMYFGHHHGQYIRMAWAADIEGPWTLYNVDGDRSDRGVLCFGTTSTDASKQIINVGNDLTVYNHMASPEAIIENDKVRLYFHSPWKYKNVQQTGPTQITWVASSAGDRGVNFNGRIVPVVQTDYYATFFKYNFEYFGFENQAKILKHPNPSNLLSIPTMNNNGKPFNFATDQVLDQAGNSGKPLQASLTNGARHIKTEMVGDDCIATFSCTGDIPERLFYRTINMKTYADQDFSAWKAGPLYELARAEAGWEGGQFEAKASSSSAVDPGVNELRDPDIFKDNDGQLYVFYTGQGENAIGVAKLVMGN